jgi:hypothetical protein
LIFLLAVFEPGAGLTSKTGERDNAIAHAKALPGNPYDGHTLATVIPEIETQIGANLTGIVARPRLSRPQRPARHKFKV